jgi:hypothetical protein
MSELARWDHAAWLQNRLGKAREENARLRNALVEARPYVFNRTQRDDWRGETARDVLGRVDAALEEKKS